MGVTRAAIAFATYQGTNLETNQRAKPVRLIKFSSMSLLAALTQPQNVSVSHDRHVCWTNLTKLSVYYCTYQIEKSNSGDNIV